MQNVQFYAFPSKKKAQSERRMWLERFRRDVNFDFSRKARVCSLHFMDGKQQLNTPFRNSLNITILKRAERLLFKIILCFIWELLFISPATNVSEWSSFFSTFSHGPLGCKIILNFKTNKVLDEGTFNYTTIYNGMITFL